MAAKRTRRKHLEFKDLMKIERIGSVCVSPEGTHAAFDAAKHHPKKNKVTRTLRLLNFRTKYISELTPGPGDHHSPAFSPNGQQLAFVSNRDKEQGSQLWVMPTGGGEARCLTSGYGGVGQPVWAPNSKRIAFSRQVVVSEDYDASKDKSRTKAKEPEKSKVYGLVNPKSSARVADGLLFRHWDTWRDRRRNHVFVVDLATGKMNDLTPFDMDAPPLSLGSAIDYDFSPDGKELAFVMNPDQVVAQSTNNSVFVVSLRGIRAAGEIRCISNSEACDCHPRYSNDGKTLYYLGMKKIGYEADKMRIKAYDRDSEKTRTYLDRFDRSPETFVLQDSGDTLVFRAQDRGRTSLYRMNLKNGSVRQLTQGTHNGTLRAVPGSDSLLVTRETSTSPTDLYFLSPGKGITPFLSPGLVPKETAQDAGASSVRLTQYGDALKGVRFNEAEEFWYNGADGDPFHGFLIRPPGFSAKRKYPLVLLIHGGPQSAFLDHFH